MPSGTSALSAASARVKGRALLSGPLGLPQELDLDATSNSHDACIVVIYLGTPAASN